VQKQEQQLPALVGERNLDTLAQQTVAHGVVEEGPEPISHCWALETSRRSYLRLRTGNGPPDESGPRERRHHEQASWYSRFGGRPRGGGRDRKRSRARPLDTATPAMWPVAHEPALPSAAVAPRSSVEAPALGGSG